MHYFKSLRFKPLPFLLPFLSLLSLVGFVATLALAGDSPRPVTWVAYQNPNGPEFFNPREFYKGRHPLFPEMEIMNSEGYPDLTPISEFMEGTGIPVMIGTETNYESSFDLYLPTVGRSPYLAPSQFSTNEEFESGHLYLLQHDSAHHFAGIPGLRRSDLKDLDQTRKKMIEILLLKEVFATGQSSLKYIPTYWHWRDQPPPEKSENYRRYAQGFYTGFKPLTPREHIDLIQMVTLGQSLPYVKKLWNLASSQSVREAREAGVPRILPDFSDVLGVYGDSLVASAAIHLVEPFHAYFRKAGYQGFLKYSTRLADLNLKPWYIEWSDDFEVGIPLDRLKERTLNLIEQLKVGRPLVDPSPPPATEWERSFLRTELALFGRRIREAQVKLEMVGLVSNHGTLLEETYKKAVAFDQGLRLGESLETVKQGFLELVNTLEAKVPFDVLIPQSYRIAGITYEGYWRNPYAHVLSRTGLPDSELSPRRIAIQVPPTIKDDKDVYLRDGLLNLYKADQAEISSKPSEDIFIGMPRFLNSIEKLIKSSFLPQFPDFEASSDLKFVVETATLGFLSSVRDTLSKPGLSQANLMSAYQVIDNGLYALFQATIYFRSKDLAKIPAVVRTLNESEASLTTLYESGLARVSRPSSERYRTIRPPETPGADSDLLVDLINPRISSDGEVALAIVKPYQSIADWLNQAQVVRCDELLRRQSVMKKTSKP